MNVHPRDFDGAWFSWFFSAMKEKSFKKSEKCQCFQWVPLILRNSLGETQWRQSGMINAVGPRSETSFFPLATAWRMTSLAMEFWRLLGPRGRRNRRPGLRCAVAMRHPRRWRRSKLWWSSRWRWSACRPTSSFAAARGPDRRGPWHRSRGLGRSLASHRCCIPALFYGGYGNKSEKFDPVNQSINQSINR